MLDTPKGYDAVCLNCECAYTFANSKSVYTLAWARYCSPACQQHNPIGVNMRKFNRRITIELINRLGISETEAPAGKDTE